MLIAAPYDPNGRYGRWNLTALVCCAIGIAVQIPFVAQELYTGPLVDDLGGADISWLVGLVVTTTIYYPWARKTTNPPAQMIYPADSGQHPSAARPASGYLTCQVSQLATSSSACQAGPRRPAISVVLTFPQLPST